MKSFIRAGLRETAAEHKIKMSELESGEMRVNGFSGEWRAVKLSNICGRIRTGKLDANAMIKDGKYRFYTCAKDYYKIDKYDFDTEALLISGNGANVGYIHYYKGKFNAYHGHIF